jgi:myo-inositol-1(or 4)-monophosphatase
MQPLTTLLISSARKAIRFLQRDFFELELLQSSKSSNEIFCKNSYSMLKERLIDELQKYVENIFFSDEMFDNEENLLDDSYNDCIIIHEIDSVENFSRSIPFFGISIAYLQRINGIMIIMTSIVVLPTFDSIYYAEKGCGGSLDSGNHSARNLRLRVSSCNNINSALCNGGAQIELGLNQQNARIFASNIYELILFISGKIDVILFLNLNNIMRKSFELLIQESGGMIAQNNQIFVATNPLLSKYIDETLHSMLESNKYGISTEGLTFMNKRKILTIKT